MPPLTPLRCIIGASATGSDCYFQRPYLIKKIRRRLDNNSNILISAPRRIGKSSILKHLEAQAADNEVILYLSVQSASSSHDFFQHLFKQLIKNDEIFQGVEGYKKRSSAGLNRLLSRFRGISLEGGLQIDNNEVIDYFTECKDLMNDFQGKKVILLLDEFPDTVNNIIGTGKQLAITFLLQVRELRQMSTGTGLQFIFTGSSGLANVVSLLGRNDLINDLDEIEVPPFSASESTTFIQRLALGYQKYEPGFVLTDEVVAHILSKMTWYLPYYLQILINDLFEYFEETQQQPDAAIVDQQLLVMVGARSQHYGYFEYWLGRLKHGFDEPTRQVAVEILNQLANDSLTSLQDIKSLTFSTQPTRTIKHILNVLEHDGYISENQQQYGFNSFLLKQWWLAHVAA